METKTVLYEASDGIATISLNRPHRMNAWTGRMHTEYREALLQAEQDTQVRAIIITGEGKGFCVGGDSQALEGHAQRGSYDPGIPEVMPMPGYGVQKEFDALFAYHFGLTKPVIAAINGPAAGVGLVLACFADIRFAVPNVKLTTAHGKLSLPAEYGLSWLLPRMIGLSKANELLLSSRKFTSDEAFEMGLIHRLVDAEKLMAEVKSYVKEMIETVSPESLACTKKQIYMDLHRDVASSVEDADKLLHEMMKLENYKRGVKALLKKERPDWEL